jgi:putative peptidoglycan lipid II flippase
MQLIKSIFSLSFFTIISRIFGFLRDIAIAYKLGTGTASDILFIALKLPNFFRRIFAEGAFSQAFIPVFSDMIISENEKKAFQFANHIYFYLLVSLSILVIIFEIFMPFIMNIFAPGFASDPNKFSQLVFLCRITFPYIILITLVSLINGVLNNYRIFVIGAILPIIYNISLILVLFSLAYVINSNIIALSYGLIIAGIIQLALIYYYAWRKNYILYPKYQKNYNSAKYRKFWKILLPAIVSSSVIQLNSWIDVIIASIIPNAVSYIYYSERLVQLPLAVIGIAISTAFLPSLTKMIVKKEDYLKLFNQIIILALFFTIPAMLGLIILHQEIITTLFARGAFDLNSVNATSKMLQIYALAVPAFILSKILLTNFYARKDSKTPLKLSIITLLLNLILNLILIRPYSFFGIAIATVISSWLNVILLYYFLNKIGAIKPTKIYIMKLLKIILCNIILGIILIYSNALIVGFVDFSNLIRFTMLISVMLISLIFYLLSAHILGIYKISKLKKFI